MLQSLLGGGAVPDGGLEAAFDEHAKALAITHMTFAQFTQALEHQLGIGLGGTEAVAGFRGAADHLGRQVGNIRQQGFGITAVGVGVTFREGDQGLVKDIQLRAHFLGHGQG
ncbi:hypothetical protein D3C76_1562870 [compost metagenome]